MEDFGSSESSLAQMSHILGDTSLCGTGSRGKGILRSEDLTFALSPDEVRKVGSSGRAVADTNCE